MNPFQGITLKSAVADVKNILKNREVKVRKKSATNVAKDSDTL